MSERVRILMCPPEHFRIGYAINPWMDGYVGRLDRPLARMQWQRLHDAISEVAEVVLVDPQPGLPDMVFTANAGTVYGKQAVLSRFYHEERQGEETHFRRWFEEEGFRVHEYPEEIVYEGAGDSLIDRGGPWLWAGYGFRTDPLAHSLLGEWFGLEVVSIRLVDPRFYHIDTCLCPLDRGFLLYHPLAFNDASCRKIEQRVPRERRVQVTIREADAFACNAVNVGEHIFMNQVSPRLRGELEERGFNVVETPMTEFLKSGGSAKCLTLRVSEPVLV